jgi:phosphate/sulfate permease
MCAVVMLTVLKVSCWGTAAVSNCTIVRTDDCVGRTYVQTSVYVVRTYRRLCRSYVRTDVMVERLQCIVSRARYTPWQGTQSGLCHWVPPCSLVLIVPYVWGLSCDNVTSQSSPEHTDDHKNGTQVRQQAPPQLFAFLQILAATFASFARGGNDVRWVELNTATRACSRTRVQLVWQTASKTNNVTFSLNKQLHAHSLETIL